MQLHRRMPDALRPASWTPSRSSITGLFQSRSTSKSIIPNASLVVTGASDCSGTDDREQVEEMKLGYSDLVRSPARSSARLTMVLSSSLRAFWEANAIPGTTPGSSSWPWMTRSSRRCSINLCQ
jgi:hypothetical protein